MEFQATEGGFVDDEFSLVCGLSGNDFAGDEHYLNLSRVAETEDAEEDWGVHVEFDDQGNGAYNCVGGCRLNRSRLSVELSAQLGDLVGITRFEVSLAIDDATYQELLAGLPRVFRELDGILVLA
jgi:hypothetical protein